MVIIVGLLAYLAFKPKQIVAPTGQTTTTNNPSGSDYQPTVSNNQTPSQTPQSYTNASDHFSLRLPTNMSLSEPDPAISSYTTTRYYYVKYPQGVTPQLPYFRNINVSDEACPTGESVTINGIQFSRTDEVMGGMESASVESTYCTKHASKTYWLRFSWPYARHEGPGAPDRSVATSKFNNELTQLHLQFVN